MTDQTRPISQLVDELRLRDVRRADVLRVAMLAAVYIVAARAGLELDAVSGFATLVWPASGIALAALVLFGVRLWPGVALGAFTANMLVGAPALVAVGIGVGNTLEAVVGAWFLRRLPGFTPSLSRMRDALWLIVGCALLSTVIAATIGAGSLQLGGRIEPGQFAATWRAWWLGDAIGDLIVAPFILVWSTRPLRAPTGARVVEMLALLGTILVVGLLTFQPNSYYGALAAYLLFPVGIWASLRFGPPGAVTTIVVSSVGAVVGTVLGYGPFLRAELHEGLFALQFFTSVVTVTLLILAAAVAERRKAEEEARAAHREADDANRSKSEFLAVMSHELRTPLHAIAGYAELLTIGAHGSLNEKQLDSVSRIQRNQQHMNSIITDVLSFARLEAGRLEFETTTFNVNDALDEVEPLIQPELRRKRLVYERHSCPPSLHVVADREKLRQILLNFLSNAAKYTETGGTVSIGVEASDRSCTIWVRDSGIGIPSDQLARVFDAFYQVERGRTRRFPGIGLGLTIARDLARAMGGDVTIESAPGHGTRVALRLPRA